MDDSFPEDFLDDAMSESSDVQLDEEPEEAENTPTTGT